MKQRSKLSTLVSLATALDVHFSLFDALDAAEASAARQQTTPYKMVPAMTPSRRPVRSAALAEAQATR